jgi:hypothetical protein
VTNPRIKSALVVAMYKVWLPCAELEVNFTSATADVDTVWLHREQWRYDKFLSHEVYCSSRRTRPIRVGVATARYARVRVAIKQPLCRSVHHCPLLSYPHTRVAP